MKPQLINITLSGSKTIYIKHIDQPFLDAPFHFHNLCELVWIQKGQGNRIIGDSVDNFTDGDLVLMAPSLPHIWRNDRQFYNDGKEDNVKSTVIYFPEDFLLNITDEESMLLSIKSLIKKSKRGLLFYGATRQHVVSLLSGILVTEGFSKIISFLSIIDHLAQSNEFKVITSVSYTNRFEEQDTDRIDKVYKFLLNNFHRDIELKEVSDLSNMTTNSFCRFFKSRTNKSFVQFLNELRIANACKLLQQPIKTVAEASYESGFNSLTRFNKCFKSIKGMTPSAYRSTIFENNSSN